MTVLAPPLSEISAVARPYPAFLLHPGDTALALFCAAYLGHNDAIHFARNDMTATCVDIDGPKLVRMAELYPADWRWYREDAWTFAERAAENGRTWDVVSVDTFTGTATERSLTTLDLWCSIANRAVTATIRNVQKYATPRGWESLLFERSPFVSWLVLTRA